MTTDSYFKGDGSRLFLLLILYIVQGMPMGFLLGSMPVMLKKYFDYTELGIIALSPVAYQIKFIFAVLVDTKYFEWLGKRKSWIIPAQLLAGLLMYYMGCNFDEIIAERSLIKITFIFSIVFF
jgi:PAT family acetyl-CoA transporter-like MFS transporter 1